MSTFREVIDKIKAPVQKAGEKVSEKVGVRGPFHNLEKEASLGRTLHSEVIAAMNRMQKKDPSLKEALEKAYGFAVIPSIGRASLVLGGAYGVGEVFVRDRVIGYAAIIELTIGVQVGGTTFHEIIVFNEESAWKQFKGGKYAFAADASVAIVKAGAQASKGFGSNTAVYVFDDGGMLLDLAIGVQKFTFKPAALGKLRTTEQASDQEGEDAESSGEHAGEDAASSGEQQGKKREKPENRPS